MKKNSIYPLEGFTFRKVSSGAYQVTYESDYDRKVGRYWTACIEDMTIIDETRNADAPKRKDVEHLRYLVKRYGTLCYINDAPLFRRTKAQLMDMLEARYPWRAKGFYGRYTKADIIGSLK